MDLTKAALGIDPAMAQPEGRRASKAPKPPRSRNRSTRQRGLLSRLAQLDRQLLKLAQERARLVKQAVEEMQGTAGPEGGPLLEGLDEPALDKLVRAVPGPLPERTVRAILRELKSGCRAMVQQLRIAFLGPQYSYSHLAAMHRFGQGVEFVPVGSIAAVFEEVNAGHCHFGLVPIENSTDGRIADTLDMLTRMPVRICGEVEMRIHHTLLGKCRREEVREVYSRPQALSQCRNWLAKHLPQARAIEVPSTSTAAQLAGSKPAAAAIASRQAGVHWGLDVLAENIEDNPANTTRFAVIGDQISPRTGDDRTARMFQTEHRFGALADALQVFKRNRLNLTWIESFPVPESDRAYLFFVELEGHEWDVRVGLAFAEIEDAAAGGPRVVSGGQTGRVMRGNR